MVTVITPILAALQYSMLRTKKKTNKQRQEWYGTKRNNLKESMKTILNDQEIVLEIIFIVFLRNTNLLTVPKLVNCWKYHLATGF